jgi:HSP20 family protein
VADSVPRPLDSVLRTLVVRPVSIGSVRRFLAAIACRDSERTGGDALHAIRTMLSRRSSSPFELFDRLEQQLSQQLQTAERVPAAEVHETPEAYEVVLELPGVDKAAIEVKATERTLLISAERRSQRQLGGQPSGAEVPGTGNDTPAAVEKVRGPLLSEFRYGTWSRSFRFPVAIEREQLQAVYRDGLLTVTAPKANTVSTVTVKVEG